MNGILDSIYLKYIYCILYEMKFEEGKNFSCSIFFKLLFLNINLGKIL